METTTENQTAVATAERDYHQRNIMRSLPCPLNDSEVAERSRMREKLTREIEAIDEAESAQKQIWKAQRTAIESRIDETRIAIETSTESRPVICDSYFEGGLINLVRRDTGKIVESRPARASEAQASIPGLTTGGWILEESSRRMSDSYEDRGDEDRDDDDIEIYDIGDIGDEAPKKKRKKKS
jgi:hypothetical protein